MKQADLFRQNLETNLRATEELMMRAGIPYMEISSRDIKALSDSQIQEIVREHLTLLRSPRGI